MADPPRYPDTGDDRGGGPDRGATAGTPRWVKVFGIVALVLVLLVVIMILTGRGGEHGPGRHSSGGRDGAAPHSSVTEGHTPPGGVDRHTPLSGATAHMRQP